MTASTANSTHTVTAAPEWRFGPWYRLHVLYEWEGDQYSAVAMNLPGCVSQGDTLGESTANIKEACQGLIASYLESGKEIPWLDKYEVPRGDNLLNRWLDVEAPKGKE